MDCNFLFMLTERQLLYHSKKKKKRDNFYLHLFVSLQVKGGGGSKKRSENK